MGFNSGFKGLNTDFSFFFFKYHKEFAGGLEAVDSNLTFGMNVLFSDAFAIQSCKDACLSFPM